MGMYKNFTDIINVLNFDEDLLRLLYYPPANSATKTPDPLDSSLPNILNMDEQTLWNLREERILFIAKTDDLIPDKPLCRLLLYAGRRVPSRGNYAIAVQEVTIDILCHDTFENGDLRSTRIGDRLNELLIAEKITGIGKFDYYSGSQINTPKEYTGYRHIYQFGSVKK